MELRCLRCGKPITRRQRRFALWYHIGWNAKIKHMPQPHHRRCRPLIREYKGGKLELIPGDVLNAST